MNISISICDVGVWVHMDPTFAQNIFMLCAMVMVARLCTGESSSQNSNHTFVYLKGGWVFQPPRFMHLCCGAIRRALPLDFRTVYPDPNEHPAGMCGECHLCHRPNCLVCSRCQDGMRCTFGLCYFMNPMLRAE